MYDVTPTPSNPIRGNAGQRDPREPARAYAPRVANDLQAGWILRQAMNRGRATGIDARDIPGLSVTTQGPSAAPPTGPMPLVQATYPLIISEVGFANAIQLVPKNLLRKGLKVTNPLQTGGQITFSFNAPIPLAGIGGGIPVNQGDFYEERTAGTISVDAIYVWSDDATANFPIPVIVYEGVPVSS